MEIKPHPKQFEVFYDGKCPLCRREINMVRRKDIHGRLLLTDIANPKFDATQVDKSMYELMRQIHGRTSQGEWVTGVEVFREIYSQIGFQYLVGPTKWPGFRHCLDFGYRVFAYFRYRSAVRRVVRETGAEFDCNTSCSPLAKPKKMESAK